MVAVAVPPVVATPVRTWTRARPAGEVVRPAQEVPVRSATNASKVPAVVHPTTTCPGATASRGRWSWAAGVVKVRLRNDPLALLACTVRPSRFQVTQVVVPDMAALVAQARRRSVSEPPQSEPPLAETSRTGKGVPGVRARLGPLSQLGLVVTRCLGT